METQRYQGDLPAYLAFIRRWFRAPLLTYGERRLHWQRQKPMFIGILVLLLPAVILPAFHSADVFSVTENTSSERPLLVHLHIAKTAGSSLNRYIARKYLGVCGHKG